MEILQIILGIFTRYGYYFLFFATAMENIPVVGMFLPGEVIVVAAGFFAASGEFDLTTVIIVACFGAIFGTIISYTLGYRGGRTLIELIAVKLKVNGGRLESADKYFSTHGPATVFVGRYMSGVKAFIPALAGAHKMRFFKFIIFATLGIVSWTVLAGVLGYLFGANWEALIDAITTVGWGIALLVIVGLSTFWYLRVKKRVKKTPPDQH